MSEGLDIKGSQRKLTNFDSSTIPQGFKQDVYGIIKDELDNTVAQTANLENFTKFAQQPNLESGSDFLQQLQAPGLPGESVPSQAGQDYAAANKQYAQMAGIEDMANKRLGTVRANRENSLTDTIAEGAGFIAGGAVPAIALGAANKVGRKYGASMMAVGADKLSKILQMSPDALGKYAGVLKDAAARGNTSLAITNYALSQHDENYRKTLDEAWGMEP